MAKLRKLMTESKYLKREFGEALPTFKGVMKQHQINKLEEGWWDNMSDEAQAAYIKKYGEAPGSTGDDDKGDKARATAKSRDKALDKSIWGDDEDDYDMGEVPGSRGTGPWTPEDDPDFEHGPSLTSAPGRVPDDPSRARGRDDVPKEPLARGTKVTASWKGLSGEEQEIPDGQIEDVKYSDSGHEVSYVIRWNNGNNLIELPADKVKGVDDKGDKARATAKSRDKALDKSIWGKEESAKPKYEFAEFYERFKR